MRRIVLLLCFSLFPGVSAGQIEYVCEADAPWTALLDRESGWLAGDGIFSLGMEGRLTQGSANENSRTLFLFSDSFIGEMNPDRSMKGDFTMVNHCAAILQGKEPDRSRMEFLYNRTAEGRAANLFDRKFWLGDGIIIDSVLYTTGTVVNPKTWEMEGPWLISVPIRDGRPDFADSRTEKVGLFHKDGAFEVLFGIGITDCGPDIYVYGFRDEKGTPMFPRELVVAKAPRKTFSQIESWTFWNGRRWSEKIADCNHTGASLAEGMSNELSVTKMIGGPLEGKFVLVYTEKCITPKLNFAISDSPFARFTETTTFYVCPEPEEYAEEVKKAYGPKANLITYNAKAHPRLSPPGELLVSYNLNVFGMKDGAFFTSKDHGFPRFVRLKFTGGRE